MGRLREDVRYNVGGTWGGVNEVEALRELFPAPLWGTALQAWEDFVEELRCVRRSGCNVAFFLFCLSVSLSHAPDSSPGPKHHKGAQRLLASLRLVLSDVLHCAKSQPRVSRCSCAALSCFQSISISLDFLFCLLNKKQTFPFQTQKKSLENIP